MTTVAYRNGVIACDSCWTYSGTVDTLSTKIQRLSSGALVGMAGQNDARSIMALLDSVKTLGQIPSFETLSAIRSDSLILLVLPSGRIFKIATSLKTIDQSLSDEDLGAWEVEREFAAIGSGAELALGAMQYGASALDSVTVACEFDPSSRMPVHKLDLRNDPNHNSRRKRR